LGFRRSSEPPTRSRSTRPPSPAPWVCSSAMR
jgi:hypothetical protein